MLKRMSKSTTLWDKDAIRELLARYCFLLDGYRLREFAALFAADGEWISRNGKATGPEAIEHLLRGMVPRPRAGRAAQAFYGQHHHRSRRRPRYRRLELPRGARQPKRPRD